jgi:hypothetical protein
MRRKEEAGERRSNGATGLCMKCGGTQQSQCMRMIPLDMKCSPVGYGSCLIRLTPTWLD